MKLRNPEDRRALVWACLLFPALPAFEYARPDLAAWLLPLNLYLAYSAGVLTHYQNHRPVFVSRAWNAAYSTWLSIFYGFPIWSWIPTHNLNHHRHTNGPGDDTRTWRYSNENTLFNVTTYPLLSSRVQLPALRAFALAARERNPRLYRLIVAQTAAVPLVHAGLFAVAVAREGAAWGAVTYLLAFGLPALFAPWAMMFTNYIQHVHCDPASPDDHSRNFVDPLVNWFVFDAGFHTVHHDAPGVHWSRYRALHEARQVRIDPRLNEHSVFSYCLKNYVLGVVFARLRTTQLGQGPSGAKGSARGFGEAPALASPALATDDNRARTAAA